MLQIFRPILSYNRNLIGIFTWFIKKNNTQIIGMKEKILSRQFIVLLGKRCWHLEEWWHLYQNRHQSNRLCVCGLRRRKHWTAFGLSGLGRTRESRHWGQTEVQEASRIPGGMRSMFSVPYGLRSADCQLTFDLVFAKIPARGVFESVKTS